MGEMFFENNNIVSNILNHFLNAMELKELLIFDDEQKEIVGLYKKIEQKFIIDLNCVSHKDFLYIKVTNKETLKKILPWLKTCDNNIDFFLYLSEGLEENFEINKLFGKAYTLKDFSKDKGSFYLRGKTFQCIRKKIPMNFKVLAIIHVYNEKDILSDLLNYLLEQELDIYILDNWSNDGSYKLAEAFRRKYPKRIFLERFPKNGKKEFYDWYNQMNRTEDISKSLQYNWFIHYDADEMRVSPWKNITLREAIYHIDALGYNLIENTVINFKLTEDDNENIFMKDTYFDFGHKNTHFMQIKTWKKTNDINLKESGGHIAVVNEPKIFPLKILNRHYPFRNSEQAMKKVFKDRKPRFEKEYKERGWHKHYDSIQTIQDILQNSNEFLKWNKDTFFNYYIPLFTGCGIYIEETIDKCCLQFPQLFDKRIVIYGAGGIGKKTYQMYVKSCDIVAWVDQKYKIIPNMFCENILSPDIISTISFDYLIIAVNNKKVKNEIKYKLLDIGVDRTKII